MYVIRAQEWATIIGRNDLAKLPPHYLCKNYSLCGQHFESDMFRNAKQNRLVIDAMPTQINCIPLRVRSTLDQKNAARHTMSYVILLFCGRVLIAL
jgi:hypothetical protein